MKPYTCHKNLHNGLWAISMGGVVQGYATHVVMSDVTYHLNPNKQKWTREKVRRSVHLWAKGHLSAVEGWQPKDGRTITLTPAMQPACTRRVRYNPFRDDGFVFEDGTPFTRAECATFGDEGVMMVS